nr:DNA mismatch repair protein MutS [Desulfurispira natronophila]
MRQYHDIKSQYTDAMLFFRMGDFYELFGDDAVTASKVLSIALTSRDKGEKRTPMAGIPHHALDGYLHKLVAAGHKAVICDQLEDPRQAKGIVKRGVTRVITPSTVLNDQAIDPSRHNYLAALCAEGDEVAIVLWDLSTASVKVIASSCDRYRDDLARYPVAECIAAEEFFSPIAELTESPAEIPGHFDHFPPAQSRALALARHYLSTTQFRTIEPTEIERITDQPLLLMDHSTCRNLELLTNMNGGNDHTLLWVLDRTQTAMGGRLLRDWIRHPLFDRHSIERRLEAVELLVGNYALTGTLRDILKGICDLERTINRIALEQHRPRDLVNLRQSLHQVMQLREHGEFLQEAPLLSELFASLADFQELIDYLAHAISDEPSATIKGGQVIRNGFDETLDRLRGARGNARDQILHMEADEKSQTGIPSLKIRYNKVFGYYIEVPKTHQHRVPQHYIRKQTLVNAERFVTEPIKELESLILEAEEQLQPHEEMLYSQVCSYALQWMELIVSSARAVAQVDVLSCFAQISVGSHYNRPHIDDDTRLEFSELRHPVIECIQSEPFIANDLQLDTKQQQLMIITGPNMAGKSTYMRQSALAVIMAQMGCFVPATKAHIGLCDRIFTRVGASDNLAEGKSTFMVEMSETAFILQHATRHSLIVIDEVGRGTSTFDGISIAWSVAEHLSGQGPIGARTLFATHFHELTDLEQEVEGVFNCHILISEKQGQLHFLRKVAPGCAPKSYGIEVARLAQLPQSVIERAYEILSNLEAREYSAEGRSAVVHSQDPPYLFGPLDDPAVERLREIDPDCCTPRQALELLYELKQLG